jgi:integrase/recombinase XerD
MALNLYRRHSSHCIGGRPLHAMTYESDETRRGFKKCSCPIYASGTLNRQFKRKNTERDQWLEAKAVAAVWEDAGWGGEVVLPAPAVPPVQLMPPQITIERAIKAYLAEHAEVSAINTQMKYRLILKKFSDYSEFKGYTVLAQWGPIDVREFRASWGVSPLTASKNMTVVKAFFEFAVNNEWVTRNPARLVKEVRGRADGTTKERIAFTDDELKRMFKACEESYGKTPVKWSRTTHHHPAVNEMANYRYRWTGQDLADFISVSLYTGLRISDVCTFHISRLRPDGECHIRTTKNGRKVYTWLPEWLQARLRARAEKYGPLIFGEHTTKDLNVVTDIWRRKLKRLWDLCGPWPEKPTPHRFRHTFARILLQRGGVTVRDVAELLGDSENTVRKHYAAWVPERQARLTKVLKEAFDDKPRPITKDLDAAGESR